VNEKKRRIKKGLLFHGTGVLTREEKRKRLSSLENYRPRRKGLRGSFSGLRGNLSTLKGSKETNGEGSRKSSATFVKC